MLKLHAVYKVFLAILLGAGMMLVSVLILASPQGGEVKAGDINITSDNDNGIDTLIVQQSPKGIIDWQSFSIGATEHTHFNQPGPSAVTLNRVIGGDISSILGQLTATGHVWLLNPSGILFGPNARVDVAGLLATTANISNENFLNGNYYFEQGLGQSARIINQGYIKIADDGMMFLVAPGVENSGVIEATLGKVVLGSTPTNSAYVLDFYGDQLLQFVVSPDVGFNIDNAIIHSGRITAPGGKVLLTANTAKSVVDKAINMSGIIEANTISDNKGNIVLSGGEKGRVFVTGKIAASNKVKIQGEIIDINSNINEVTDLNIQGGNININTGEITTFGSQSYNGPVVLGIDTNLTGTDIDFANTIDGNYGLDINATGVTTFGNTVGATNALSYLTVGSTGGINLNGENIKTTGTQQYKNVVTLGNDVALKTTDTGGIKFDSTIGGLFNLGIDAKGNVIFGNAINVGSLDVSSIGTTNINTNTITTVGSQKYLGSGDVVLGEASPTTFKTTDSLIEFTAKLAGGNKDVKLDSGSGEVKLGAVENVGKLELSGSGNKKLSGNISNTTSLDVAAGGTTSINAPSIITTGTQWYKNAVTLGNDVALKTTDTGGIKFDSTIGGLFNLGIDAKGNVIFGNAINVGSLDVSSIGTTNINTNTITTVGSQKYLGSGDVVLGEASPTTFKTTDSLIEFTAKLAGGNKDVKLDSGSGEVKLGAVENVGKLELSGSGNKKLSGNISNTTSLDVAAGGTTSINAPSIITTGTQWYKNAVTLGNDVALKTTDTGGIKFDSTIGGLFNLGIDAKGNVIFGNAINIGSLDVSSIGTTNINTNTITTVGSQKYLGSGDVVLGEASPTTFKTTDSLIEFTAKLAGGNKDVKLDSGSGEVKLGAVENVGKLELSGSGNKKLSGNISNTTSLDVAAGGTTSINAPSIITTGTQWYKNAVTLGNDVALKTTDTGGIKFDSTIGGLFNLGIDAKGNVIFGNAINVGSLDVSSIGTTNINTNTITTVGSQKYLGSGDVVLGEASPTTFKTTDSLIEFTAKLAGGNKDVKLDSGSGEVKLGAVENVGKLELSGSGNKKLSGNISNTTSLDVAAGGTTSINAPSIITTGTQWYKNAVTLGNDVALKTTDTGGIKFDSTIGGLFNLGIDAKGNVIFGNAINVGSLDVSSIGTTNINTNTITTVGSQKYLGSGDVVLGEASPTTFKTTDSLIEFTAKLAGGNKDVKLDSGSGEVKLVAVENVGKLELSGSGNKKLSGNISNTTSLDLAAGGTTSINTPTITTTGTQKYKNDVTLEKNTTLKTTGAGDIVFDNTINGYFDLGIDAKGNVIFGGEVGAVNALTNLDVAASGKIYISGGSMNTIGRQLYRNPVILTKDTLLTSDYNIGFSSTIDSDDEPTPRSLTVNASENTVFNDVVGGTYPLLDLTTDALGTTYLYGSKIITKGKQTYNDAVALRSNMTLNAIGNDITFNSTINGPFNLILDTSGDQGGAPGDILFGNTVGTYAEPIGAMYIKDANDVTGSSNIYTTLFVQDAGIGTTKFVKPLYVGTGGVAEYISGAGDAVIKTNRVEGIIDVGRLFLGVNSADLTGSVAGKSDPMKAALDIGLLSKIQGFNTHYFNMQDLYLYPLQGVFNQALLDSILAGLGNYNFGFGYEFLNTGNNEFDYMLLLDPLECEVSES